MNPVYTLEQQRAEFASRRFLAMPLAGTLAWTLIGVVGAYGSAHTQVMTLYFATGAIFYLGLLLARFTGEDLLGRKRPKNCFDRLFLYGVIQAVLVFALALPFGMQDHTALPLGLGVLTGLMWLPFSWIIDHWIGIAHAVGRTVLCTAAWFAFPEQRFTLIPALIVAIYLLTIIVLERCWQRRQAGSGRLALA